MDARPQRRALRDPQALIIAGRHFLRGSPCPTPCPALPLWHPDAQGQACRQDRELTQCALVGGSRTPDCLAPSGALGGPSGDTDSMMTSSLGARGPRTPWPSTLTTNTGVCFTCGKLRLRVSPLIKRRSVWEPTQATGSPSPLLSRLLRRSQAELRGLTPPVQDLPHWPGRSSPFPQDGAAAPPTSQRGEATKPSAPTRPRDGWRSTTRRPLDGGFWRKLPECITWLPPFSPETPGRSGESDQGYSFCPGPGVVKVAGLA